MQPQVVRSVTSADGRNLYSLTPRKLGRAVSRTTASKLTTMMLETTASGTAAKYFRKRSKALDGIQVAGKTGSLSRKVGNQMMHYSWFVGFAPADKPVIAFASLVVNGPKWKVKGPVVARKALDAYFGKSLSKAPAAPRRTTRAPKARILPSAAAL
jgi:cell division protein FtsI/penicillin-binding protein 2